MRVFIVLLCACMAKGQILAPILFSTSGAPGAPPINPPPPPPVTSSCNPSAYTGAAIQACINASAANDVIYIPQGVYILTTPLTSPGHCVTLTGARAHTVLSNTTGSYGVLAGDCLTMTNLVFRGGGVDGNGATNLTFQYDVFLDIQTSYAILDSGASHSTFDHNVMAWTNLCTDVCSSIVLFYKTYNSQPNTVTVSSNYVTGAWEGIGFGGFAPGDSGANIYVQGNTILYTFRMAIEDGTPIAGHHIDNNYIRYYTKAGSPTLDPTCGEDNIVGNYDCNSFGISLAGGGSTSTTINNNRMYGQGVADGSFRGYITSWGIEMTAAAGQLQVNGNVVQHYNYGIWDDADSGNTQANRGNTTNNSLCEIASPNQRAQGAGWAASNSYSNTCPAPDPVPCAPFDWVTGGVATGCG